jgi:hypothetical protein
MAEVSCVNQITCGARTNVFLNDENAARTACIEQWNRRTNGEVCDGANKK